MESDVPLPPSTSTPPIASSSRTHGKDTRTAKDAQDTSVPSSAPKPDCPKGHSKSNCKCKPIPAGTKQRNLVVCIDGTANQFGLKNTHVVELYSRLEKTDEQLTYYDSGIGTFVEDPNFFTRVKQRLEHGIDMAIAIHLKDITLGAYQWLSENYRRGDRIYLFGFSRGAYQVRIVAGMIQTVGLLHKGNNKQIPFAYQLYAANTTRQERKREAQGDEGGSGASAPSAKHADEAADHTAKLCEQFKNTLCHEDVTIHFVGVWDTVSSVGVVRGRVLPETMTGMHFVCFFRHALALDELRIKFLPEYAHGGHGPECACPNKSEGDIKEVWFAGSHSDIGGGNATNIELDRFGPPLRWILYEAMEHGLYVKQLKIGTWVDAEHHPSMNWFWRFMEYIPIARLSYTGSRKSEHTVSWPPHRFQGRVIQPGQLIHASVLEFMRRAPVQEVSHATHGGNITGSDSDTNIESTADSDSDIDIESIAESNHSNDMLLPSRVDQEPPRQNALSRIQGHISQYFRNASKRAKSTPAPPNDESHHYKPYAHLPAQHLWDDIIMLRQDTPEYNSLIVEDLYASAETIIRGLQRGITERSLTRSNIDPFVGLASSVAGRQSVIDSIEAAETMLRALEYLHDTTTEAANYDRSTLLNALVQSLNAFSSPPANFQHRSTPKLRSWLADVTTSQPTMTKQIISIFGNGPLSGPWKEHTDTVWSVVYSTDGARVASGSTDTTIRLWDAATGQPIAEPLQGHERPVYSVAFSPDGKRIVSGSDDNTIRLWDTETHQAVGPPLTGHEGSVTSVKFSPDGKLIASGSDDETIRIWDAETRHAVGEPLRGHTDWVQSVAFSPDGRRIASGSGDKTVRIWDLETRAVVRVLQGHSHSVWRVVFSPDGRRIVSGSLDDTIRVWDAESGETILGPLRGHEDDVNTVAVSPDGRYIASGSDDHTVRLWDAQTGEAVGEPLRGHTRHVFSVAFSPDSRRVVSGSWDNTLMIWDVESS